MATPLQPLPPSSHGLPPASASLSLARVPLRTIRMFSSLHPSLRLQGPLFQIRSQSQVLGVKTQTPPPGSPFSPLPGPRCVEPADLWTEELPVKSSVPGHQGPGCCRSERHGRPWTWESPPAGHAKQTGCTPGPQRLDVPAARSTSSCLLGNHVTVSKSSRPLPEATPRCAEASVSGYSLCSITVLRPRGNFSETGD